MGAGQLESRQWLVGPPVRLEVERQESYHRGLAAIKWLLLLPHYVALIAIVIALALAWLAAAGAILVTGRYPRGLFDFIMNLGRWCTRVLAYALLLTDRYPPFSLQPQPGDPVTVEVEYPPDGRVARWRPPLAWLLLGPVALVVIVRYLVVIVFVLIALVSIVSSGRFPPDRFDFIVGTLRQHGHMNAYAFCLSNTYPF